MAKRSVNVGYLSSNKEMQNIIILSSSIAHELKNYLTGISICTEFSEGKLKDISDICREITESRLKNLKQRVKAASYLISNLQLQMKNVITGKPNTEDFKQYSMTKNIQEALEQYPFEIGEKELITVEVTSDFDYVGNPVLTNHVLYNLIKNSLRAIKNADKGKITIRLESSKKFNKLIFRDTATGIPKKFLPKIFGLFESLMTAQGGTGIGLTFCKLVIDSYGGNITCDSIENEYTEFVLEFPFVQINQLTPVELL